MVLLPHTYKTTVDGNKYSSAQHNSHMCRCLVQLDSTSPNTTPQATARTTQPSLAGFYAYCKSVDCDAASIPSSPADGRSHTRKVAMAASRSADRTLTGHITRVQHTDTKLWYANKLRPDRRTDRSRGMYTMLGAKPCKFAGQLPLHQSPSVRVDCVSQHLTGTYQTWRCRRQY